MLVGVHLCRISDIRWERDSTNKIVQQRDKSPQAFVVTFKNSQGHTMDVKYPLTPESQWRIDKLCTALGYNVVGENSIDVKDVINQKSLYVMVGEMRYRKQDGTFEMNPATNDFLKHKMVIELFRDLGLPPQISGDPIKVTGQYLIVKEYETSYHARRGG